MYASDLAFAVLALAALGGAAGVLLSRSTVHAVLWSLESSVAVAGLYVLLSAEFLALAVVILWGGAASLALLVTIAVTARHGEPVSRPREGSLRAAVLAVAFAALMLARIAGADLATAETAVAPRMRDLGEALFAEPALMAASGALSLMLLLVMIAGVWWSRGGDGR